MRSQCLLLTFPPARFLASVMGFFVAGLSITAHAETPVVFGGDRPADIRLGELRTLNSEFPFARPQSWESWPARREAIRRRILLSQGLWPMPSKPPLDAVVHGRVERDDYVVDRVYFQSIPGHYVTGSLYRPQDHGGKQLPAILSPHGHWKEGRFYDAGESQIRADLAKGAERFEVGGRYPIQARAVQLARMGCLVFVYDMTGNADSIQIGHRPDQADHLDREADWGFFSAQAELRLQNMMGLQTWNSICALDFLLQLPETDPQRIGVTGASGGGTQSMIIAAIDERITAAMPCVMVSTSMQGGCTCENAPYLRIDQGNIDIAAAVAPRPLGLTAADDWTVELESKGYPDLRDLYSSLGAKDKLTAAFNLHFKHNYNHVNRAVMYGFFNRHFRLGFPEPVLERDFVPLSRDEATVWTDVQPRPREAQVGDRHETRLLAIAAEETQAAVARLIPRRKDELGSYREVIGGAWKTILRRSIDDVGQPSFSETAVTAGSVPVRSVPVIAGHLDHRGEQLPVIKLGDRKPNSGVVILVTDHGKSALLENGHMLAEARTLIGHGYQVLSADLIGQGEFAENGDTWESQPMWYQRDGKLAWHRFSGYTFGYNDPLFVQRTHDVLTMIKHASETSETVHLVGIGRHAGPIVLAARAQSGDAVSRTFVDCQGFRFQSLTRQDDPMFVPGAVKYLDVDGLLSLCVPHRVDIVGEADPVSSAVARAASSGDAIRWHEDLPSLVTSIARLPQQ